MRLAGKRNNGSEHEEPFATGNGNFWAKNRRKIAAITVISIIAVIMTLSLPALQTVSVEAAEMTGMESLKPGSIVKFGGYDWRVLDVQNGKALILCETVIEHRAYNDEFKEVTWETCTLRGYLNGELYNKFSDNEKALIAETTITNNDNPWYGTSGGSSTKDRIFLLSLEEVVKYFGDSGQLANIDLKYEGFIDDQYNSARIAKDANGNVFFWWLRSPGILSRRAAYVNSYGCVSLYGFDVNHIYASVRPALWLNM